MKLEMNMGSNLNNLYYYDLATAPLDADEFAPIASELDVPNMLWSDCSFDNPITQEPPLFDPEQSTDSVLNNRGSVRTSTITIWPCTEIDEYSSSMTYSAQSASDSGTTNNSVPLSLDYGSPKFPFHQTKATELQPAGITSSNKLPIKPGHSQFDVARRAMCKCDYPGCHKAFQRNEHLKRHKQTFHGEGPDRFSCEFCGKDQFNPQANLNNHRKLHARPNTRNRGVQFIPAAVPIIEQEERSKKRRAPAKHSRPNERYRGEVD